MKTKSGILIASVLLSAAIHLASPCALAQEATEAEGAPASPKKPWGDFTIVEEEKGGYPWWAHVLLWVPNRALDFFDIFRVDVGLGNSYGGVIRLTKYAQAGYRKAPHSVRIGLLGRQAPFMVEEGKEYGIGPGYTDRINRKICPGEFAIGIDAFAAAHAGLCLDEAVDFLAGIFFLDVKNDDIK